MTEPTYTLLISDADRADLARVLGKFVHLLANARVQIESPSGGTQHARAVLSPPPESPAAARPSPTPVDLRDRWARDRKGVELPNPDGCYPAEITIWKTEQKPAKKAGGPPYLKVTWQSPDRGYVDANCFDSQLFPWLIKQQGQRTKIYLLKAGEYRNVVGVCA